MIMEQMDVDLSIVKKERMDLGEDYGNILDNFTVEHDYNDFSSTSTIVSFFSFSTFCLLFSTPCEIVSDFCYMI